MWQTPRTWIANEKMTATKLNPYWRDELDFLYNPPACFVANDKSFQSKANIESPVSFPNVIIDTDSMTGRFTSGHDLQYINGSGTVLFPNDSLLRASTAGVYLHLSTIFFGAVQTSVVIILRSDISPPAVHSAYGGEFRAGPNNTWLSVCGLTKLAVGNALAVVTFSGPSVEIVAQSGNVAPIARARWMGAG